MRLFVCEFVTGGGLYGLPLPASLAVEGDRMVRALLTDLAALDDLDIVTTRDPRLDTLNFPVRVLYPPSSDGVWSLWRACMESADAVWPIAPESSGILEYLSRMASACGCTLLGSRPEAVAIAASKQSTLKLLGEWGIPVVETQPVSAPLPASDTGWVVKPDDGVGCEDTCLLTSCHAVLAWVSANSDKVPCRRQALQAASLAGGRPFVIQPYVVGEAASLSLLCREGSARILSVNRQLMEIDGRVFHYRGSVVNAFPEHASQLAPLAEAIAQALPGLWGYAGVDLVLTPHGPVVLEVNPRLTTSYVGLYASLRCNPAGLVLALLRGDDAPMRVPLERNPVRIEVAPTDAA
jgi:Predicted ATP-utilizing enzyme (ATP-grasp superfamily)